MANQPTQSSAGEQATTQRHVQVLVLGGGPGGYSCAIRAAQLGLDVLLVEENKTGGTCLHEGCIPSKALIHAAARYQEVRNSVVIPEGVEAGDALTKGGLSGIGITSSDVALDWSTTQRWKTGIVDKLTQGVDGLLAKAGVQVLQGSCKMLDGKRARVTLVSSGSGSGSEAQEAQESARAATTPEVDVLAQHVVIAVGSEEVRLPLLKSGQPGDTVVYAREALSMQQLPRHLAVVGGGYIGLELGQAFARLGTHVTIVEAQDSLLPAYPKPLVAPVMKALTEEGVDVLTGALAQQYSDGILTVNRASGETTDVRADKVLVAVGRRAKLEGWGREELALDLADGYLAVNSRGETSMSGIYAVGDVTGEPMLAHRAIAQGQVVAEVIAGRRREFAPTVIPAICFTSPEIVSVGETAASARDAGLKVLVTRFPLAANGRALTLGSSAGYVEVVADESDHVLLGVQAVGEHIAELAHSFTLALEMGARLEDIADTIHAHPTIGESFAEASAAALGIGVH